MPFARGAFRLRDVLRRVHVHLDEASVRRSRCCGSSMTGIGTTTAPGAALISHTHNQCTWTPVARPAADARRLPPPVRNARAAALRRSRAVRRRRRAAGRSISRGATTSSTLEADPALTIDRQPASRRLRAASARSAAGARARRIPRQPAVRRGRARRRRREATRPVPPAVPVRRLRTGIRRVPPVPAGGRHDRPPRARARSRKAACRTSSPIWSAGASSSTCRGGTTRLFERGRRQRPAITWYNVSTT